MAAMSKGDQTRQLIISRAVALARHTGLEQVTLGVLAADLDVSKSGLFAHFKSKEALQLEVVAEVIDQFTKTVVLPGLSAPRGVPRVQALFEGYLRWIHGQPKAPTGCLMLALTYEYDDRPGPVREALLAAQRDWLESLARVAKSGIDHGAFVPTLDPKQFAFEFEGITMAHQLAIKLSQGRGAEALARRAFADFLTRCTR